LARLDESLLANLPILFEDLQNALKAHSFSVSDLPAGVLGRYVAEDGRYRIQVYPREDIFNHDALERFVDAVAAVAPNATDTPVSILEAGRAVVRSFVQATIYALLAITLVLLYKIRNLPSTALILLPLLLALDLTFAASVALSIPFNFANVIIVPLLLGIGVDTGIHFIHRFRTEPPPDGNMLETSTARAVFFSALTTTMSFGTLAFSRHQGMAGMGKLLALCMTFLILTTFFLLPVLLNACESCKMEPHERDDVD
jgi:predicted RND superfamily exporter protein